MKRICNILCIGIVLVLASCKSSSKVQDGETAFKIKKYTLAAEMLQKDYSKTKDIAQQSKIALKIAQSYDKQLNYIAAETWYKKIADARVLDNSLMLYVNALKRNEKYTEALKTLEDYLKANKTEKFRLQKEYDFLQAAVKQTKAKQHTKLSNLEINTESIDFSPFLKDNILYFSSTRGGGKNNTDDWTGEGYADIYSSQKLNDIAFNSPVNIGTPFNSPYHDANIIFTKNGKTAFFTRCGSANKNVDEYCHIYRVDKNIDDSWSTPQRVKLFADTINEGQAYLSTDENELYFSSDNKDGYGGRDIYFAKKNIAGEYENPINAGSKINGQGDELFPVIANDNTLYFSSNSKIGYGGLDIFAATKEGKIYTNVQNLGFGVNSGADDLSLQLTKVIEDSVLLNGYLVSNRSGGKGKDDIYYFVKRVPPKEPLPTTVYVLNVHVQENNYENPNNPSSKLLGQIPVENAIISLPKADKMKTNSVGKIQSIIPANVEFTYNITKDGHLSQVDAVSTFANNEAKDGDTVIIERNIILSKIYKNVEIVLENIYYDYDKWDIRADATESLTLLVDVLEKNPNIKIELASHTDCRGKDAYNETLSQKRAESVVKYLIGKGIDANRLTAKGYGETMPIEKCDCETCTEEQHQKNRRTTFKIVSE
ncbi:MAG TPA: OmpA family protein [Chitinophagales bacterium]|nr:OmpA family protein [Chitinophagales bacterium]